MANDISPEKTNPTPKIEVSLDSIIEVYKGPEAAQKVRDAEEKLKERSKTALNNFLNGVEKTLNLVDNKTLGTLILIGGEAVGIGGYGLTDAYTLLLGVRDIAEGRHLGDNDQKKAYLRGSLRILGALLPAIPSFWVGPVTRKLIPIPEIDINQEKSKDLNNND